jgi:uncharacterized metal-binding protein
MKKCKVIVIPCSGIGKSLGTVGRTATYKVIEQLRPNDTRTVCLALLTMGDPEARRLVKENPCISIDGCPAQCSKKNIEASKGDLTYSLMVTDILRENRGLKPEGVIQLNAQGEKLAEIVARKIVEKVDDTCTRTIFRRM